MGFDRSGLISRIKSFADSAPQDTDEGAEGLADAIIDSYTGYTPTVEAWTAPTLLNGWANYGGSYNDIGYYKDPHGRVHLRGLAGGGVSVPTVIFNLPSGYRPSGHELAVTLSCAVLGRVDIHANGNVEVETPSSTTWVSLDGISFRAA